VETIMAKQNKAKRPIWIEENLPAELANSTLFKFMVQLQVVESKSEETGKLTYKTIEVDMLPDLDLDYDMLEDQMMRLPAQYAYWAAIYSELKLAVAVAERKLKARKGRVIERITSEASIAKVRLTVEQVKAIAEADSEIRDAELKYEKAQMTCGKIYHTIEALRIKAELARSLAGFKRQEQERS
jgi:hypothetical protein